MVVYDERNNRLEIVSLLENRKRYIPCTGIDPAREKVLSVDAFGDEIRVRVVPRVGPAVGTGVARIVKFSLAQARGEGGPSAAPPAVPGSAYDPFAARDPKPRF